MNNCKHELQVSVDYKIYNQETGEDDIITEYETRSTFEDIDLHRYKCTQCGEIGYYSGAAKNYYENGIKSEILGLK